MFAQGSEARGFASLRSCVKRTLYGCDCYAYALCASGFVDLVCEADLLPYDYLALVPVLEGAGAVISDWDGRPLTLANHSKSKGRVIAAANAELHVAVWTSALRGYHLKRVSFVICLLCADVLPPSSSRARDVPAPCLQINVHIGPCRPPHGPTTRSHRAPHLGCRSLPWRTTLYCRAGGIPLSDCSIAPRGLNAARNKLCAAAGDSGAWAYLAGGTEGATSSCVSDIAYPKKARASVGGGATRLKRVRSPPPHLGCALPTICANRFESVPHDAKMLGVRRRRLRAASDRGPRTSMAIDA